MAGQFWNEIWISSKSIEFSRITFEGRSLTGFLHFMSGVADSESLSPGLIIFMMARKYYGNNIFGRQMFLAEGAHYFHALSGVQL